jgi:hypothetical protein
MGKCIAVNKPRAKETDVKRSKVREKEILKWRKQEEMDSTLCTCDKIDGKEKKNASGLTASASGCRSQRTASYSVKVTKQPPFAARESVSGLTA